MPNVPPAVATVGAIIGANLAVTLLWKYIPPAWRLLNRYFVIVPYYPSSLGIIGSTFSHQTWRHLGTNMMVLALMGTRGKLRLINPTASFSNMTRSPRRNRPWQLPRNLLRLWSHGIYILTHAQRSPRHSRHDIPGCECRNQRHRRRMVHVPLRVCDKHPLLWPDINKRQ